MWIIVFVMDYLDILTTTRMLIFGEFTSKHKDYWNIQDMTIRNLRTWEIQQKKHLEPSKTATPHSCDTPAPLSWTCSRPSQALVQRSHTPVAEFALPSQPCRTKPHHKLFQFGTKRWGEEHGGRKGAKEGGAEPGNKHKVSPTSRPREPPRAS